MTENCKRWRVATVLTAIISDRNLDPDCNKLIKLVDPEDTKYISSLKRELLYPKVIEELDDPTFSIKLEENKTEFDLTDPNIHCGFSIFIKSDQLPDKDYWYELSNFYYPHLSQLILQNNIDEEGKLFDNNGDFNAFHPCISSSSNLQGIVTFASELMDKYLNYNSEAIRKLNVDVMKKTKRWIPGHRYDSATTTIFYLGKVKSTFDIDVKSKPFPDSYDSEAYLIIKSPIYAKLGSISKVLETCPLVDNEDSEDGIILISHIPGNFVDSGEALKNDVENFNAFKPVILKNTVEYYRKTEKVETQLSTLLKVPQMTDAKIEEPDPKIYKEQVEEILSTAINFILYENWEIKSSISGMSSRLIGTFKTQDENIQAINKNLLYIIRDSNTQRGFYYPKLFEWLGIDINSVIEDALNNWDPESLTKTVEGLQANRRYLDRRKIGNTSVSMSSVKLLQSVESNVMRIRTLSDVYGNGELTKKLVEMIRKSLTNSSAICNVINYTFNDTKANKVEVFLDDVIRYENGSMSQALKDDIVKHQFCSLSLWIDAGKLPE